MAQKKSSTKTSRRPYRKRAVGGKKRSVSVGVRRYVKNQIHKNIENKCIQVNGGYAFGNVAESTDLNVYPMVPYGGSYWTVPQGIGQGARIGNQITIRKVYLNYILSQNSYQAAVNPNPQPSEVRLMLGNLKLNPGTLPTSTDINNLFQSGTGVSPPAGTLRDLISVYNKDYWNIKKSWTHKIGYAESAGTGSNAVGQFYSNNDFKMNAMKRIDITKLCPKKCTFNDGATGQSLTKNLFFMQYAVAAQGGLYTSTQQPVSIEFWIDFEYEDA